MVQKESEKKRVQETASDDSLVGKTKTVESSGDDQPNNEKPVEDKSGVESKKPVENEIPIESNEPASNEVATDSNESAKKEDKLKRVNKILSVAVPVLILLLAAGLWYLFTFNWDRWEAGKATQTTDDAIIQADIIPLSTLTVGTIETVNIRDFQKVKEGDLLVTLRTSDPQARVDQAKAGVKGAQEALDNFQIQKQQHEDRIRQAQTGVDVAQADIISAQNGLNIGQNDQVSARIGIETAGKDVRSAEAGIEAANADAERSNLERTRQQNLYAVQAATKQRLESTIADNERAVATLKAREIDKAKAQNLVKVREQDLLKAQNLQRIREQDLRKAQDQLSARRNDLEIALKQREVLNGQERQLQEDLKARQADLVIANTNFDYTRIIAPRDGVVGEVKVKPGQHLSSGGLVASLVTSDAYVMAYFKETQVAEMKEGDAVEISVSAVPDGTFRGQVHLISPASGSEFSVIPTDRSSGTYTRVTQRIPVKIVFKGEQIGLERLRPGMSATLEVRIGSSQQN